MKHIDNAVLTYKYIKEIFPATPSKSPEGLIGSLFALYPGADIKAALRFITSFQAICGYLDSLLSTSDINNDRVFRRLRPALLDAVDLQKSIDNYHRDFSTKSGTDHLTGLVKECRQQLEKLPSYRLIINTLVKYVQLYGELQPYKYLSGKVREEYLQTWTDSYIRQYPEVAYWEFAAATGSTMGILALFVSAFDHALTEDEVAVLDRVYFPWIGGLHMLLNNYVDSRDALLSGEPNLISYYNNLKHCEDRLHYFIYQSIEQSKALKHSQFHRNIIKALVAIYLSDPKAHFGMNKLSTKSLLYNSRADALLYYKLCRLLRITNII